MFGVYSFEQPAGAVPQPPRHVFSTYHAQAIKSPPTTFQPHAKHHTPRPGTITSISSTFQPTPSTTTTTYHALASQARPRYIPTQLHIPQARKLPPIFLSHPHVIIESVWSILFRATCGRSPTTHAKYSHVPRPGIKSPPGTFQPTPSTTTTTPPFFVTPLCYNRKCLEYTLSSNLRAQSHNPRQVLPRTTPRHQKPSNNIPTTAKHHNHHAHLSQARQLHSRKRQVPQPPRPNIKSTLAYIPENAAYSHVPRPNITSTPTTFQKTPSTTTTTPKYQKHPSNIPENSKYSHVPRPNIKSTLATFQKTPSTTTTTPTYHKHANYIPTHSTYHNHHAQLSQARQQHSNPLHIPQPPRPPITSTPATFQKTHSKYHNHAPIFCHTLRML